MRESELLSHIYAANASLPHSAAIPPGDDMAMVRTDAGAFLIAVDQLVDGRHVRLDATPLALVGRKAVTRSLSDIAAMAARPVATLVAATLPPDFGSDRANQLFDAMRETAEAYDCPLVGGDIAFHADSASPFVCSTTVLARPGAGSPVTRGGAEPGDSLYVTGRLGGSLQPDGLGRHLTFEPRIAEALALSDQLGDRLHAMIDISDGLGKDAGHIAAMSGVAILVRAEAIPCQGDISWLDASRQGEDYELCFAAVGSVPDRIGSLAVTKIGEVLPVGDAEHAVKFVDGSRQVPGDQLGWEHESHE